MAVRPTRASGCYECSLEFLQRSVRPGSPLGRFRQYRTVAR